MSDLNPFSRIFFKSLFALALGFSLLTGTLEAKPETKSRSRAGTAEHTIIPKPENYVAKRVAQYFSKEMATATVMKLKVAEKGVGNTPEHIEAISPQNLRAGQIKV